MKSVGHNLRREAPQAFAKAIASKSREHLNGQVQILKTESLHPIGNEIMDRRDSERRR
jgi:hypothetical protein